MVSFVGTKFASFYLNTELLSARGVTLHDII